MNAGADSRPVIDSLARLYFPLLACVLGIFVFSGITWLIPIYFSLAYIILSLTLLGVTRDCRDYFNPLLLVLSAGFIRFCIPGLLISANLDPNLQLFATIGFEREDWILGHALALMGLLGVVIGWLLRFDLFATLLQRIKVSNVSYSGAVSHAAILGMLLGFAALLLFVRGNASFEDAIYSGEMRGAEIQVGTGKYFHLSLMFIASSIVFSAYLIRKNYAWWITLIPTIVTSICFLVLGGRVRAFLPTAAGLLMLWYRKDERRIPVFVVALLAVVLPVFAFVVQTYRALGVEGLRETFSLSSLVLYVQYAVWADWGQLHGLAGAIVIGPGVLEGRSFLTLLWPLTKILDLPTRSSGVLIAETLFGFSTVRKFSFHAALIGDAYLNFGLIGVLVITIVFGAIVREVYVRMRQGRVNKVFYAVILVYSVRIFFEGIDEFSEMWVVLIFAWMIISFGQILANDIGNRSSHSAMSKL